MFPTYELFACTVSKHGHTPAPKPVPMATQLLQLVEAYFFVDDPWPVVSCLIEGPAYPPSTHGFVPGGSNGSVILRWQIREYNWPVGSNNSSRDGV